MNKFAKVGIILGGYIAAFTFASFLVYLRQRAVSPRTSPVRRECTPLAT